MTCICELNLSSMICPCLMYSRYLLLLSQKHCGLYIIIWFGTAVWVFIFPSPGGTNSCVFVANLPILSINWISCDENHIRERYFEQC